MVDAVFATCIISWFWIFLHCIGYQRFIELPDKIKQRLNLWWGYSFPSAFPVILFALLIAYEDSVFKYGVNIVLTWILWDLGIIHGGLWTDVKTVLLLNLHHLAPVLAHHFQYPELRYYYSVFFFFIWVTHTYGAIDAHILKPLGLYSEENRKRIKWTGAVLTGITYSYSLYAILYSDLSQACMNQFLMITVAQLTGRYIVNRNFINVKWLGQVELPLCAIGVVCYFVNYDVLYSIGCNVVWLVGYYQIYSVLCANLGDGFPKVMIYNEETKNYLSNYDLTDIEFEKDKLSGVITWYENQPFHKPEEYPLVDAIIRAKNDKVKELIDNGHNLHEYTPEWYNSCALAWAAGIANLKATILLIQAGVDPYSKNEWGKCHVDYACATKPVMKKFIDGLSEICNKYPPNKKVNNQKPKQDKKEA